MNSITKPPVAEDQLAQVCRKHLGGSPSSIAEMKDGWFNAVFKVAVGEAEYVLKVAPPDSVTLLRYERDMMEAEVAAMRFVADKTNLPIPRIISFDTSRDILGSKYLLTECIQGMRLDAAKTSLSEADQKPIEHALGRCVRELHSVRGSVFGMFGHASSPTWHDGFGSLLEDLRRDQIDKVIELPSGTFEAAVPHFSALDEVKSPSLIHWDLWDPNVFVSQDGGIAGIIDFERAMWADPLMEARFMNPTEAFVEGYGLDLLREPGAKARRALYNFHLSLVMVIECTYRGFDADHEKECRGFLNSTIEALNKLE